MNWVLIIALLILFVSLIDGYCKGFLRILFSLVSLILMIVLVGMFTPQVTDYIKNNTGFYEKIQKQCEQTLEEKLEDQTETPENEEQVMEIAGIKIPSSMNSTILKSVSESKLAGRSLVERTADSLADFIIEGIAFFVTLLLAITLLKIVGGVLDIVARIPVLKGINRFLGLLAGMIKGLIIIWLAALILTVFCTNPAAQEIISMVYENPFLSYLYEHNGISYLLTNIL